MLSVKKQYKKVYEKRAEDGFEEKHDKSRHSRIPFYFRYIFPKFKNILTLDVGAADGIVIERFKEKGIGCDIALKYCIIMRDKGIQSVCCCAENLPFRNNSFSFIIASAILEHVLGLEECVAEIIRVIRRGGMLMVNVPYMEDLSPYLQCKYELSHLRSFDEDVLLRLFRSLKVIRIYYHDFSFIFLKIYSPLINRMFGTLFQIIPKIVVHFLLKIRWTRWIKPSQISILFSKA